MKLPVKWLKKYVEVGWSAQTLSEKLTLSGTKVEHVDEVSGEDVLQIEVTTNRPDCLSILGLAKEVAVLSGQKVQLPKMPLAKKGVKGSGVRIDIQDKKGCPKYTARLMRNVEIKPAPAEPQKFLAMMGARPVNNVVDATNFVLFETGQPLHAFDYDRLKGGRIVVRRAKAGEKFLGIDGVEYTLDAETLVIADAEAPVAIAGVLGGKITEVTPATRNILLESAYFDPVLVRHASKKYKMSTDSSYRFERGVDAEGVELASARAAGLIADWSGGKADAEIFVEGPMKPEAPKRIVLRLDRMESLLGLHVASWRVIKILKELGCEVGPGGKDRLSVTPPAVRRDLTQETDLAEEILRIEGFDKVEPAIPVTKHTGTHAEETGLDRVADVKRHLAAAGFSEIVTYSLLPSKALLASGIAVEGCAKIVNPVSAEQEVVRPSLLPGMLQTVLYNISRKAPSVWLFEAGKIVVGPRESAALALALYGSFDENWRRKSGVSFFELKGAIENLFRQLKLSGPVWRQKAADDSFDTQADILLDDNIVGFAGAVSAGSLSRWDIPHEVFYAEMDLDRLLAAEGPARRAAPVPKYPFVRRDIAFILDEKIAVESLEGVMKEAGAPHLRDAKLFDQFTGKNIPAGKRSLAFSLAYQKESGTFTDEEIQALQERVGQALKSAYHVEFR
ncbi:MAG: phenylalanine--tRNA ligase subunit beta [Candidatus Omnitrophota bacterium]